MINFFLSILVHKKIITEDEAKELSTGLGKSVHSFMFADAHKTVEAIFKDIEKLK